jgi:hypothetical protein
MGNFYNLRNLAARILIGLVLFINIQASITFIIQPNNFAPWYELSGYVGRATIQGFGVLFLMWNVPYLVAFTHPQKHRTSLFEALAMQTIGLFGEIAILAGLPTTHQVLRSSIIRFIIFDSAGLLALIIAVFVSNSPKPNPTEINYL